MHLKPKTRLFCTLIFLLLSPTLFSEGKPVGPFSSNGLVGWQSKSFLNLTDYRLVQDQTTRVLQAQSNGQASVLIYQQRIDLHETPWLNWRWKIKQALSTEGETTKSGDDYVARIYVVIDGGVLRWKSKALNYVWSSRSGDIANWPNAYMPKNAMMMAIRNGMDETETWYDEKRNVLTDLKQIFGKDIRYIDAIAVMTDTDDTQQSATAWYGDIFFSEQ